MSDKEKNADSEPLPIWFFVGLILFIYGIIVLIAGLIGDPRPVKLAEVKPALWWSAIMIVFGFIFLLVGWRGRKV